MTSQLCPQPFPSPPYTPPIYPQVLSCLFASPQATAPDGGQSGKAPTRRPAAVARASRTLPLPLYPYPYPYPYP